jgi:hypothetical protein
MTENFPDYQVGDKMQHDDIPGVLSAAIVKNGITVTYAKIDP